VKKFSESRTNRDVIKDDQDRLLKRVSQSVLFCKMRNRPSETYYFAFVTIQDHCKRIKMVKDGIDFAKS
jgi:hypothetical protein